MGWVDNAFGTRCVTTASAGLKHKGDRRRKYQPEADITLVKCFDFERRRMAHPKRNA